MYIGKKTLQNMGRPEYEASNFDPPHNGGTVLAVELCMTVCKCTCNITQTHYKVPEEFQHEICNFTYKAKPHRVYTQIQEVFESTHTHTHTHTHTYVDTAGYECVHVLDNRVF